MSKKTKIAALIITGFILYRCTRPVTPKTATQQPEIKEPVGIIFKWNLTGFAGYKYGSDYLALRNERTNGEAIFNFYGQNVTYPTPATPEKNGSFASFTDSLVICEFPSHSINYLNGNVSAINYKVFDSSNKLVLEVYDTRGGTGTQGDRANNHPDNCKRWIKKDLYRIEFKNIGTETITFDFGTTKANQKFFSIKVKVGESISKDLDMRQNPEGNEWHSYKLNCNVK